MGSSLRRCHFKVEPRSVKASAAIERDWNETETGVEVVINSVRDHEVFWYWMVRHN